MPWAFGDGMDCYAAGADAVAGYWDSGAQAGSVTFTAGRFAGSQAVVTGTGSGQVYFVKASGSNDAVHHISLAFRQTNAVSGSTTYAYLQLQDGTTAQCSIVFRQDGALLLTSGLPGGTVLATYTGAFPVINTWYQFEIEVVISNTAGSIAVRRNGNTSNDFALGSLNTRGGTANSYANKLQFGNVTAGAVHNLDDLFWRSDAASVAWMGDIRCYTRMPASDASVQFSRSTGATNFSCVDEAQQNAATDYVFDSTPGDADLYGIASIASTPLSTVAVTTRAYMQKSDAGTRTAAVQLKSGSTTVASPTLTLSSSGWLWAWRTDTVDPNTSSAWTAAAVSNAQIGPKTIA